MTEAEWLACDEPEAMLDFLEGQASERKLRLFACACCRRIWHVLTDAAGRNAVAVAERFADGEVPKDVLALAADAVRDRHGELEDELEEADDGADVRLFNAVEAACKAVDIGDWQFQVGVWALCGNADWAMEKNGSEYPVHCALLRDIFGDFFRPVAVQPSWLTSTVVGLAEQMYQSRDFSPLPILADALEDAGCADADLLSHLRSPGPHVRGCWALDLILGRE